MVDSPTSLELPARRKLLLAPDGYIELPTEPGLGIELDEDAVSDKIDHDWLNRESYHPDDESVVDW